MKKSPLTKKEILSIIIKQRGDCNSIAGGHCSGGWIGAETHQRFTLCPLSDYCHQYYNTTLGKEETYKIAVTKFVEKFGKEALVEVLM